MERAVRYSRKREAILQAIRSTNTHPSAEWVYQTLKPCHPDLSLGTVYRNLTFLREQGLIQSVGVVNGQERFDGLTSPHSHFVCSRCGGVSDLHGLTLDADLDRQVGRQYRLVIERHELLFRGVCQKCSKTNYNQEELAT
ncbi:MAG: transcriptional repressor [Lawsonibacter sp.]|nr:transcriptional repressor [Lawsonibacter sp.]